jgi:hypothetical protein
MKNSLENSQVKNASSNKSESIKQEMTKEELMAFRFIQSKSSRLAEYLTGLRPDDRKMPDRLIEDQKIIREKYHLPPRDIRFETPSEYEYFLLEMAKKNNVLIKDKSECGRFFEKFSAAGAYMEDSHAAVIALNRNEEKSYKKGLGVLEHELIHAEQSHQSGMPIELREYEAYVAGLNMQLLKERPEDIETILFSFFIWGSVAHWYREQKEVWGLTEFKPVWDDPDFFLVNIDGFTKEEVEEYKKIKK